MNEIGWILIVTGFCLITLDIARQLHRCVQFLYSIDYKIAMAIAEARERQ